MVVNSFDLWQKDIFFSAAEEVQKSADIMESAYRLWIREKKDEICNELQAALGTAKWQLEEFEKAVILSHRRYGDDSTRTRHKQFVSAIENQILRVETSLQEAYFENARQPLRWVDLNEEERDDLALFLSGTSSQTSQSSFKSSGSECVIDIEENVDEMAGTRRMISSSLRIIVPGDNEKEENKNLVTQIEATPKVKGTKPFTISGFFPYPMYTQRIKLMVSLMLVVFLLLPIVVYSS